MRICIVADSTSYRFGGEAILPAHYFAMLRARGEEVWLVTHARTRPELEAAFPEDRDRIHFIQDAWIHRFLFRFGQLLPRRVAEATVSLLSVLITQYLARKLVVSLRDQQSIDVVHQPTPVAPRFPSILFGMGIPLVIGPMNGGMEFPPAFRRMEPAISRIGVRMGRAVSDWVNHLLPGKKRASVLLVANRRTELALPRGCKGEVVELPENGVVLATWTASPQEALAAPPRFVSIGRLVDFKRVDVAIEALQRVPGAELEIIGDGPLRAAWEDFAQTCGVAQRVKFLGWRTQQECAARLGSARALLMPSVWDCGGAVVLEAMAAAVPVIATNWGGPADYVDSASGVLIEPSSRAALVEGFASAMRQFCAAPEDAARMGRSGQERVRAQFDWDRKIDSVMAIYRRAIAAGVLTRKSVSPAFD